MWELVKKLGALAFGLALLIGGVFGWVYAIASLLSSEQDQPQALKGSFLASLAGAVALVYIGVTQAGAAQDLWLVLAPGFSASVWLFFGPNFGKKTNGAVALAVAVGVLTWMLTAV